MVKKLVLLFLLVSQVVVAQDHGLPAPGGEQSLVKWMTLKEAMEKNESQPRPIFIDFYTDWCGWCKRMMATTYSDPNLAGYINAFFYPVKFDAEGKDTVEYLGEKFVPTSKEPRTTHPLAIKLLQGKLMYPTTLFLNGYEKDKKNFKLNMLASGYLETQKLEPILIFTLENAFRNSAYDDFRDGFQKAFYDSATAKLDKATKWLAPSEFFNGDTMQKKKTLVLIDETWCNSCRVMKQATLTDSLYRDFLNEKFNLVEFNPEVKDTLIYKGKKFTPGYNSTPYHSLSFELARGGYAFPSAIFLDENMNILDVIGSYMNPKFMNEVVHFYGGDFYKTKSWKDFEESRK